MTESFTKINKREYQKPIVLHNQFEVLNCIDNSVVENPIVLHNRFEVLNHIDDSVVENKRPVTDQNIQSCDKNKVCKLKTRLVGEKNETGCLNRDRLYTKQYDSTPVYNVVPTDSMGLIG